MALTIMAQDNIAFLIIIIGKIDQEMMALLDIIPETLRENKVLEQKILVTKVLEKKILQMKIFQIKILEKKFLEKKVLEKKILEIKSLKKKFSLKGIKEQLGKI